jgi:hypothetical protein
MNLEAEKISSGLNLLLRRNQLRCIGGAFLHKRWFQGHSLELRIDPPHGCDQKFFDAHFSPDGFEGSQCFDYDAND